MTVWDRDTFLTNVEYLRKRQNLSLDALSSACGLGKNSKYFAKLKNASSTTIPRIDICVNVANQLGVSLEVLLLKDLPMFTDETFYKLDLIQRITTTALNQTVAWQKEMPSQVVQVVVKDLYFENPLFTTIYVDGRDEVVVKSNYAPKHLGGIIGPIFSRELSESKKIFLTCGQFGNSKSYELNVVDIEASTVETVAHSMESEIVNEKLQELFKTFEDLHTRNLLRPELKNLLDEFF